MDVKLIFSDVDGTLISSNKYFDKRLKHAIASTIANGIEFVLCSGRPTENLIEIAKEFRNENIMLRYVAGYNGSIIYDLEKKEYISTNVIDRENAKIINDILIDAGIDYLNYNDGKIYTNNISNVYAKKEEELTHLKTFESKESFETPKILGLSNPEDMEQNLEMIREKLPQFSITNSTPFFIEITNKQVDKGNALKVMASKLDISMDNTMCFGDGGNDTSMFKVAKYPIAVGNATDELKQLSSIVINSVNDNGVAKFLEKILNDDKNYTFYENKDLKSHDDFVKGHKLSNLLQGSLWNNIKEGWDHKFFSLKKGDEIIGSCSILIKNIMLNKKIYYIPRGPILDYDNQEIVKIFFEELKKQAKSENVIFIKFDPAIIKVLYDKDYKNIEEHNIDNIINNLKVVGAKHLGFNTYIKDGFQPRFQSNVYYDEEFIDNLPRHTKRLIKDANKFKVNVISDNSRLEEFYDVIKLTEERKTINLRNFEYFKKIIDTYKEDAKLYLACVNINNLLLDLKKEKEDIIRDIELLGDNSPKKIRILKEILAAKEKDISYVSDFSDVEGDLVISGILGVSYGDTLELLYAGMNQRFKKFMPQYLLYTRNINDGFLSGASYVNMGGVEGTFSDGLTKFKSNFNPFIEEYIGEFDIVIDSLFYNMYKVYMLRRR